MPLISGKFLGAVVWTRRIRNFGPIRKARLQKGFEEEGAKLVEKVKAAVPVRKGNLRESIRMETLDDQIGVKIIAGGTTATSRGPNMDEALFTEYGTTREKAEPFFYPTILADKNAVKHQLQGDVSSSSSDDED